MGCRAWDKGYSGICYWSCLTSWNIPYWGKNNPDRDEWDDFDTVYGDVGSFYPGSYGQPVPSLRWEAFREGIEDYCYLYILKQLIDKSAGDNPSEAERAKEAIENSIREILSNPDNYSVYSRCRRAIAEQILRLKGE
jgi:hypothetical protein